MSFFHKTYPYYLVFPIHLWIKSTRWQHVLNKSMTIRKESKKLGIPHSTLSYRISLVSVTWSQQVGKFRYLILKPIAKRLKWNDLSFSTQAEPPSKTFLLTGVVWDLMVPGWLDEAFFEILFPSVTRFTLTCFSVQLLYFSWFRFTCIYSMQSGFLKWVKFSM